MHLRTDGFKELDGGGDTGFQRNELMTKLRYIPAPGAAIYNEIELKLGLSNEDSNESYLGLTDEDFRANPLRRYGASKTGPHGLVADAGGAEARDRLRRRQQHRDRRLPPRLRPHLAQGERA